MRLGVTALHCPRLRRPEFTRCVTEPLSFQFLPNRVETQVPTSGSRGEGERRGSRALRRAGLAMRARGQAPG